jgi:HD-like signal output (HDOD) protein
LLTEDYSIATSESPYTMGLLHDVGKLVLNIIDAEKYHSIYQEVQRTKKTFYEVEKSTLGITHSEVGKILAEKWKMSDKLVDVVAHHHEVEDSKPENIIINAVVEIADHLCNITEMSFGTDFDTDNLPEPKSWSILQENISELKNKKYDEFIDEIGSQIQSISEMVNLIQL